MGSTGDSALVRALYYPYSRLLYEADLKRAVLLFDELLFVDPLSTDVLWQPAQGPVVGPAQASVREELDMTAMSYLGGFIDADEFYEQQAETQVVVGGPGAADSLLRWYDIKASYRTLVDAGIVKLIPSDQLLQSHEEVNSFGVLGDLIRVFLSADSSATSDSPLRLLNRSTIMGWQLHGSRIPGRLRDVVSTTEQLESCVSHLAGDADRSILEEVSSEVRKEFDRIEEGPDAALTSYRLGLLLVVNQAMLLTQATGSSLLTDDPFAQHLVAWKCANAHEFGSSPDRRGAQSAVYRGHVRSFEHAVVTRLLPDRTLDEVPMESIVEYRYANQDLLRRFRSEMASVSAAIETRPWDDDYDEAIQRSIDANVMPLVLELDDGLATSFNKLFSRTAGKLTSAAAGAAAGALPTVGMAALLGLTPAGIAVASGAALMTGVGLSSPAITDYLRESRELKRNGLCYLMNFRGSAAKRRGG